MPAFLGVCYKETQTPVSSRRLLEHWSKLAASPSREHSGPITSDFVLNGYERGQSGPHCPPPGWWGIVPTTQRQHNMGDQNPCSVRPCLKNGTAASVSCTFNCIRCYLRIGTNTGTTCWNLQGADGSGEPGSVRKEPVSLKTSHHICAGSQDYICGIIMQK